MGVSYVLVESNTIDIPSNSGALTFNRGFNVPAGMCDEVILRVTIACTTGAILADFGNVMSACRLIFNGATTTDFRSGYASASNNAASQANYLLNSLGDSRMVEVPSDTAKEVYFRWPVGRQLPSGISRLETQVQWAATAAAVASGTVEWWIRYNDNTEVTTTVAAATSFSHAIANENVTVRLPQGLAGTVAGVLIQNDSAADQLNGVQVMSQSNFSIDPQMWRAFNSDLSNGIVYADDDVSLTAQQYAITCAGGLWLPLFGLSMEDDLRLIVDSSAVTTRTYTPVITSSISGKTEPQGTQTTPLVSNVAANIVAKAED